MMFTKKKQRCGECEAAGGPRMQKPFGKMKAAKDLGEKYFDPAREDNILGKKQDHD